jgi:hypothetical protein
LARAGASTLDRSLEVAFNCVEHCIACPIGWLATGGVALIELAFLTMKFKSSTTMNWWHGPNSYIKRALLIIGTNIVSHLAEAALLSLATTLALLIFPATAAATIGIVAGFIASLIASYLMAKKFDPDYKSESEYMKAKETE